MSKQPGKIDLNGMKDDYESCYNETHPDNGASKVVAVITSLREARAALDFIPEIIYFLEGRYFNVSDIQAFTNEFYEASKARASLDSRFDFGSGELLQCEQCKTLLEANGVCWGCSNE